MLGYGYTLWETIKAGGPVMVPLCLSAILAIAYTIERLWVFFKLPDDQKSKEQLEQLEHILFSQGEEAAARYCGQGKGVLNFVFAALMKRYDKLMIEQREFHDTHEKIIELAALAGGGEVARVIMIKELRVKELSDLKEELIYEVDEAGKAYLGKSLIPLSTIAGIATLLGLLGTITGMIKSFNSIAAAGTGDPRVVAAGISEALITTAAGLIIAIPTIVGYRYLAKKADTSRDRLEVYGHAFANSLIMAGLGKEKSLG